ncbi:MAG: CRTAC1 family protein [Hyphomicrobiales bacterium]|nr:VCBS repeat-containing protein [Hyphomicrobiales bacterium]MDE2016171.1 CRTAC1 family protein [Hyphomicrobiales bacterium]
MKRVLLLLAALAAFAPTLQASADGPPPVSKADIPVFHEEADAAGLHSVYAGGWDYFVGGGVASFDCDGSGYPSVFVAGGTNGGKLFVNVSKHGGPLKFVEKKDYLGPGAKPLTEVVGAYPLDIDGDGRMDLVVLRNHGVTLLKGGPGCTFTRANALWNFAGDPGWVTAFSATFERGQKFPTLAFGHYVDRQAPGSPYGTCEDNSLYRPGSGDAPDYSKRTALRPGWCALSMLFTDWNRSGVPALRVSNDRQYYRGGEEQLWHVDPGKPPRLYTRAEGWRHVSIFGMGIAEGEFDASGYPEYALTSMGDMKLQKLDSSEGRLGSAPVYRDVAADRGATAHIPYAGGDMKPSTGWHSEFADFNDDGLLDLFVTKGNVDAMRDFAAFDPNDLLLGQWDGKFVEAGEQAGLALDRKGRGAAVDDFNLDGKLDILVVNREANVTLFRNLGAANPGGKPLEMGNWLEMRVVQPNPNRDAVGATVAVKVGTRTMVRKIQVGGGHASGHLGWVHVGLGTSERAEIRVHWPDGEWSAPYRVFANNFVIVDRTKTQADYWYPGR